MKVSVVKYMSLNKHQIQIITLSFIKSESVSFLDSFPLFLLVDKNPKQILFD